MDEDDRMLELRGTGSPGASIGQSKFMESFFKEVDTAKANIADIEKACKDIELLSNKVVQSSSQAADKANSDQLNKILKDTNSKASSTHKWLKSIKDQNDSMKSDAKANSNELRIRQNMHATTANKFMSVMKDYQACQVKYKEGMSNKLTRQVKVVNPNATAEDIKAVVSTGDTSKVFRNAIMAGPANSQITDANREVQAFYQDVLKLQRSVEELNQMFKDMALLVDMQGEMLNSIEFQVHEAKTNIEKGNKELEKSIDAAKTARRNKCCLIIVVVCILLAITGGSIGAAFMGK